jgi:tetratricopeptide (TPR) repeat protein
VVAILIFCTLYAIFGREKKGQSNLSRSIVGGIILLVVIIGILFWSYRKAEWIQKNEVLGRIASISINDTKTQARGFIWPMAVKGIFESPKTAIIGIGQENFNYIFNSHYDPAMYAHEQWFDRAHSVFLDWLVAGGLLGLLAYLSLYIMSCIYIYRSDLTIGQKSVLIGLLVGYAIHNIFVFDNQTSYVMFFTFLAFVSSLRPGAVYPWFKNYSDAVSEDSITVRNYISLPLTVIVFLIIIYTVNIRPLQANKSLITSLQTCSNPALISTDSFERTLAFDSTMSNQETREQLLSCVTNVIQSRQVSEPKKMEFYNLARREIDKHIEENPNDARIYIIGGSFLNSIGSYAEATPLLEKANTLSPNKQSIMFELASNYFNIGKTAESVALMEKAYLLAPENYTAQLAYASILITNHEESKAYSIFATSSEIFKSPRIAAAYMNAKDYVKAIEFYKEKLKDEPENQENYSLLASAYVSNKQNDQAIKILKVVGEKFIALKLQADDVIKQIQEGKIK